MQGGFEFHVLSCIVVGYIDTGVYICMDRLLERKKKKVMAQSETEVSMHRTLK